MKQKLIFLISIFFFFALPLGTSFSSGNLEEKQLIIINKSTNELAFYDNGNDVKIFSVGTGRTDALTPEGKFKIVNKVKNPPYYKDGIPGGDPRNPLGNRWLGLNVSGTSGMTYGIHGNNNANSIGQYVSAGCIRMHNDEVHWLFDRVKIGADVIILKSDRNFNDIAAQYGFVVEKAVPVYVNGERLAFQGDAILDVTNRVIAPMRVIFEALGADVEWIASENKVIARKDDTTLVLTINSKKVIVNGVERTIDTPVQIRNGQTFIPARLVSEVLKANVQWNQVEQAMYISLK